MADGDEVTPLKRRGGRPPSKKRGTFSFRVTTELREKLEAEAAKSGRPVSEEIEQRLEASFREPEVANKVSQSFLRQARYDWFGSMAMFDNALVYSKLLSRFIDNVSTNEQFQINKDRAKEVLRSAHSDLIEHLFTALVHQKEFEAVWKPHDAEGTSGSTSVREMTLALRMAGIQAKTLTHLMTGEHTEEELEWSIEELEDRDDNK